MQLYMYKKDTGSYDVTGLLIYLGKAMILPKSFHVEKSHKIQKHTALGI